MTSSTTNQQLQIAEGTDDWSIPDIVRKNPAFVEIGQGGSLVQALQTLHQQLNAKGLGDGILSKKAAHSLFGKRVNAGYMGVFDCAGRPEVVVRPGCYWNFNPTKKWIGSYDMTDNVEVLGLTIAQVGQGEALVVQDPQNRVFVLQNNGFVAYGAEGRFKVLAVVDTLDLGERNAVKETASGTILGWKREVRTETAVPHSNDRIFVTAATFLNIPANNVAVLNRGNRLIMLTAGQHVITDPTTTFRCFYSLSERQHTLSTQPAYTVEGVPVVLELCLRYRIFDPVLLAANYSDPLLAIVNPAQTAVNAVVSRMSYQQFMRASKVTGPDHDQHDSLNSSMPWVAGFKNDCAKELHQTCTSHGITLVSFDVMDRKLHGKFGQELDKQAEIVLQNQMEATQIELRNSISIAKQRGILEVSRIENDAAKVKAETDFFTKTREADAMSYKIVKLAQAESEGVAIVAAQNAKNIVMEAEANKRKIELESEAYASVTSAHAQAMQLAVVDVDRRKAMPQSTVWFEGDSAVRASVVEGFTTAKGVALASSRPAGK